VKLIVGLGNPGHGYENTRHNVGFRVIDALAEEARVVSWAGKCLSLVCCARVADQEALLAKPLTFMNLSGRAVRLLLSEYGLTPADLVLALDDFSLPLGKIRIRERGSAGGHNGLESVMRALETEEFVRVRLGIGEEKMPEDKTDFVLSEFAAASEPEVKEMISKARDAVKTVLGQGLSRAMSIFNA